MSKERFVSFDAALRFYREGEGDNGIAYVHVVSLDAEERSATLRTGDREPMAERTS